MILDGTVPELAPDGNGQAGTTCSIIVPATSGPATLPRCLAAIRQGVDAGVELLVIDYLPTRSPGRLRNEGARRASGEILVFVDADVLPHPDAISRLRFALANDPNLVAAFGSYDDDPPAGTVSQFRNLLHHHVHQESAGEAQTFWTGIGAVRREAFLAAGGFDEQRPMLEDLELGMRLCEAGYRIALLPEAQCRHLKEWTLRGMLYTDFRNRGIPWTRLLVERRRLPATLNLSWRHRFSAATVLITPIAVVRSRKPAVLVIGAGGLIALNGRFYRQLAQRGGLRLATVGLGLHALHHAAAIAALPCGVLAHVRRGGATPRPAPLEPIAPTPAPTPAPALAPTNGAGRPPRISVIVTTRSRPRQVARLIEAVAALTPPPGGHELVIVQDGHQPEVEEMVAQARARGEPVSTTVVERAAGPARARNAGARHGRGELLAFTDDDCLPQRGWLCALAAALADNPTALAGGSVINAFPENPYAVASQLIVELFTAYHRRTDDPARFLPGLNLAVSRETFEAAGGFDPSYSWAADDRDFSARVRASGRPLIHVPDAVVVHERELDARALWLQQHSYGRGAVTMTRVRARRGDPPLSVSPAFHADLLRRLVDPAGIDAPPFVRFLVGMTQVAYATGMVREWFSDAKR